MTTYLPKYALATVPRYTSYPPATAFHGEIGEHEYQGWLAAIGSGDTLSLYVHIPFCETLCWYCGCHTTVPNSEERVSDYVTALGKEIARVGAHVSPGARVLHVHFGGGTPTLLAPRTLARILQTLSDHFTFDIETEIAVEADPRCLSKDHIAVLTDYAKTRVSLGVQDVSPDIQKLINRIQPFETVQNVVSQLRRAGIGGINMDLIYGLPGQSIDHVVKSANLCAELEPDRFAVFGYAHVPWFKKHQRAIDESKLPDGPQRLEQAEAVRDTLMGAGYAPIGFDHFARPGDALHTASQAGTLRRNFQGYTVDPASALIGFGASSIGSFNAGYIQNQPHLLKYREAISRGELPVVRGLAISPAERRTRDVIEKLMCDFTVDLQTLPGFVAPDDGAFAVALEALQPLVADGLVSVDGLVVTATEKGRPYIRNIAACFDDRDGQTEQRYSRAV